MITKQHPTPSQQGSGVELLGVKELVVMLGEQTVRPPAASDWFDIIFARHGMSREGNVGGHSW